MSGSRPGRWVVWIFYRTLNKPLPVPHAAEWMMIPEHSVDQVLETGALRSLYPQDVLEAARRMDRQRREHDERYAKDVVALTYQQASGALLNCASLLASSSVRCRGEATADCALTISSARLRR